MKDEKEVGPPTLLQIFASVLAAMFGVQNKERQKRDFERGKPAQFLVVGLVFTIIFVLVLVGIVKLVLSLALG